MKVILGEDNWGHLNFNLERATQLKRNLSGIQHTLVFERRIHIFGGQFADLILNNQYQCCCIWWRVFFTIFWWFWKLVKISGLDWKEDWKTVCWTLNVKWLHIFFLTRPRGRLLKRTMSSFGETVTYEALPYWDIMRQRIWGYFWTKKSNKTRPSLLCVTH